MQGAMTLHPSAFTAANAALERMTAERALKQAQLVLAKVCMIAGSPFHGFLSW